MATDPNQIFGDSDNNQWMFRSGQWMHRQGGSNPWQPSAPPPKAAAPVKVNGDGQIIGNVNPGVGEHAVANPDGSYTTDMSRSWGDHVPPAGAAPGAGGPPGQQVQGGPGLQPGTPNMNGVDMTNPREVEQWYAEHGHEFTDPTRQGALADMLLSQYANGGNLPSLNLNSAYDDAEKRASAKLASSLAATGSYGSSFHGSSVADMLSGMEADKARHEADYALQADAAKRGWAGTLSGIASGADSAHLAGLQGGLGAAAGAFGEARTRGQDAFSNYLMMGDRQSGLIGDATSDVQASDRDFLDRVNSYDTGAGAQGVSDATRNAESDRQRTGDAANTFSNVYKFTSGIYPPNTPGPRGSSNPATGGGYNIDPSTGRPYPSDNGIYTG